MNNRKVTGSSYTATTAQMREPHRTPAQRIVWTLPNARLWTLGCQLLIHRTATRHGGNYGLEQTWHDNASQNS